MKARHCFVFMSLRNLAHKKQIYCCTYRDCSYTQYITDGIKYVMCLLVMCNCFYLQRSHTSEKMLNNVAYTIAGIFSYCSLATACFEEYLSKVF